MSGIKNGSFTQGLYNGLKRLDSGFRRNDEKWYFSTFYEFIMFGWNFF